MEKINLIIEEDNNLRLDKVIAMQLQELSRTQIQDMINQGLVLVNQKKEKASYKTKLNDEIEITILDNVDLDIEPEDISLKIVYEDEDLLVINKSAGMPIHPSRNNPDNSLGNALAWYFKEQNKPFVFRCINRLDRDTSGLTIVAKHAVSAAILGQMVREKSTHGLEAQGIHREYLAIVEGNMTVDAGVISAPIARKEDRCLRRVVDFQKGDRAVTHYRVIATEVMDGISRSLVALQLETGRTHQIRVHMAYLGYPLVGDFLYNPTYVGNQIDRREDLENKNEDASGTEAGVRQKPYDIDRQALHAWKLSFFHPMTGEPMEFTAPLPPDMQRLIPEETLPSV